MDRLIDDLIAERKTYIVQRAYNPWDQNDANKVRAQIDEIKGSLKPLLFRIYAYTSKAFHVLLRWLIPRADSNYLFTRIKGVRMEHILRRREWEEGKRSTSLPALTDVEKSPYSAAHTLAFIQQQYVDADDDAPHNTWDRILKATREPKTSLYAWVDSFSVHVLRHSESTAKSLTRKKKIKINKVISKQITEDEKLIITTINSTYTSDYNNIGDYILGDLINLLAQHTSNFAAKRYQPNEHPRIIAYLKTRAKSAGIPLPGFMSGNGKSTPTASSLKRRKIAQPTQRMWTYLKNDDASTSTSVASSHGKGKPKGKSKGKGKGKSLKGKPWSLGKGIPKGKRNMARGVRKEWIKVTRTPGHFPKNDRILSCMEPTLQAH